MLEVRSEPELIDKNLASNRVLFDYNNTMQTQAQMYHSEGKKMFPFSLSYSSYCVYRYHILNPKSYHTHYLTITGRWLSQSLKILGAP